jgi:NAD(P)-dependent dehydrogenase (short-subunit alcohol dehydrogenase family)
MIGPTGTSSILQTTFGLDDRVAVVTGASSGFGAHFARVLHAAGATVVLVARRTDRLQELTGELGDRSLAVPADIGSANARAEVLTRTLDEFGRIDVLVNNAGISHPGQPRAVDESMDEFARVLDVNVASLFGLCQLAGSAMLARGGGSIVNIGSILGLVGSSSDVAYSASKGAVSSLTRALAVQWANRGVRVNCLAPGFFPTEMNTDLFESEAAMAWLRRMCPTGRPGALAELDAALLFLCAPTSTYCTGQVVVVDGGWTAA